MSPVELMALPFLECLVLVGIHSYLGIHVIKRKVIFVDLALAQIAALGAIVALVIGLAPHTLGSYIFSLLFTFLGAAIFSITRLRKTKIPQEAIIGLVYAMAAAVSILIIDRAPHGAEHIKEILTGSILWVKWQTVAVAAFIYLLVGIFHFIFRDKFMLISQNSEDAYGKGINVKLWDFLFYISFGLVITLSVNTAGVLLVFVFLVVPAIIAIMFTDNLFYQLLIGWGTGTLVSLMGLTASYAYDFPTGPMVVAVYGLTLVVVALGFYILKSVNRKKAAAIVLAGMAAVIIIGILFFELGNFLKKFSMVDTHEHITEHKGNLIAEDSDYTSETPEHFLKELDNLDIFAKDKKLKEVDDKQLLIKSAQISIDDESLFSIGKRLYDFDKKSGLEVFYKIISTSETPLFKKDAMDIISKAGCDTSKYDPMDSFDSDRNIIAIGEIKSCIDKI
ncbi:MAG: metal ABC transporter permease [Deltaproteobacteria bacterium]|nr:metal ABC transporter permease [Deltaproteobacteria bacterium]